MALDDAPMGGAAHNEGQNILGGPSEMDMAAMGASVDGLHEEQKDANKLFAEMNDSMQKLYNDLKEIVPGLKSFFGGNEEIEARADARKPSGKTDAKVSDVSKLPEVYGIPALFISSFLSGPTGQSWLADIQFGVAQILDKVNKMVGDSAGGPKLKLLEEKDEKKGERKGEKKDDGKGGGNKIRKALEGLIGTAKSLFSFAASLVGFAVAAAVFTAINWNKALVGLGYFAMFIAGSIILAGFIKKKEREKLADFGKYILSMTAAFLLFQISLLLLSFITPLIFSSFFGLALTMAFFVGFALIGVFVSKFAKEGLKEFAKGILLLTVALILFAVGLVILGRIVWPLISDPNTLKGIGLIMLFFAIFIGVGLLAATAESPLMELAKASLLLTVALLLFAIGLVIIGRIVWPLIADPFTMIGIISIIAIFLVFTAIGLAAGAAEPGLVQLALASLLLSVALIAFTIGLFLIDKLVKPVINDPDFWLAIVATIGLFALFSVIGFAASFAIPGLGFLAVAGVLMAIGLVALATALKAYATIEKFDLSKAKNTTEKINNLIDEVKKIDVGLKVLVKFAMIKSAFQALLVIFKSTAIIFEHIEKLRKIMENVDVGTVMVPVKLLISSVADSAEKMKDSSLESALAFSIMLKSVTDAVGSVVNTMTILKNIDDETIAAAQARLKVVLNEFFGVGDSPSPYSILKVFEGIKGINKSQLRLAEALVPLTESIDNLVGTVIKVNGVDPETITGALASLRLITRFVDELVPFVDHFSGGGFLSKSTAEKARVTDEALKSFIPILGTLSEIEEMASEFHGIRMNIEANVLEPLLNLEPGVQKVEQLTGAFGELNRELTKLVKENGKALTQVADLNKGNGAGFKINLPFINKTEKNEESKKEANDSMERIADDVEAIREKVVGKKTSWIFGR